MEVEYALEIDDAMAFHRYYWRHDPKAKRLLGSWVSTVLLGLLILAMIGYDIIAFGGLSTMGMMWLGVLATLVLIQLLGPRLAERNVRQLYKGSQGKGELQWRRLTLSAKGLQSVTEHSETHMEWSAIEKIVLTDEHLFLYTSPRQAIIIPK